MALPIVFGALTGGNQPLSDFDTQFAAVAALGAIPCAASGQNVISITPLANTPTVSSYVDLQPSFVFVAAQTSNGSVTANVAGLGARNVYKWNGQQLCGAGDIVAGSTYRLTPLQALNSGAGGFVCDAIGVSNNSNDIEFIIDGGGSTITTGQKGHIRIPWASTLGAWEVMADQSGSISIDILRANNAVPVTSMVGAGNKPGLVTSQFSGAFTVPSGWTSITFSGGDFIAYNVVSAVTVTRVLVVLSVSKS